jgi:uncharacterized protein
MRRRGALRTERHTLGASVAFVGTPVAAAVALLALGACGVVVESRSEQPSAAPLTASPPATAGARPTVTVTVGDAEPLIAEVAATTAERQLGLMDRDSVPPGTGMVFVFPRAEAGAFWMFRTRVPLSIVWAADGRVVGVAEMEPCRSADPSQCRRYPSPEPFDLAVEAHAGTFTDANVRRGDPVRVTGTLPTPAD